MTPESTTNSHPAPTAAPAGESPHFWRDSAISALFIIFCLELSAILCIYPWMPVWSRNWFLQFRPDWQPLLLSDQFRGALTGLGILNLFIAISEIGRLSRSVWAHLRKH